jgi:branched-chain amino acid transport system ATP-binding protein
VRNNLELGATAASAGVDVAARIESVMDRFPMLRERADAQASTLSGGQQKLLEIARSLLLDPKLMLIDEPSIGLSPRLVQETFGILQDLRAKGVTILMVEQNAKRALEVSDFGVVLELGRTRMTGEARAILADPRVGQLFLGGGLGAEGA